MERGRQEKLVRIISSDSQINAQPLAAALALEALHKQVLPFLLRRLKEDVLNDLPPKIIQDYYCELSELQKYMYDDFSKSNARASAEDVVRTSDGSSSSTGGRGQQHVFQSLQYLRKLCNHPALVLKNDTQAIKDAFLNAGHKGESSSLGDIQHAPKLLALRYASYVVWRRTLLIVLTGNCSTTVVLAPRRRSAVKPRNQSCWTPTLGPRAGHSRSTVYSSSAR
jgi:SNF2 family DNA or RNA helicase